MFETPGNTINFICAIIISMSVTNVINIWFAQGTSIIAIATIGLLFVVLGILVASIIRAKDDENENEEGDEPPSETEDENENE